LNLDLTNKNALVGGGSKGLGNATAIELAKLGANITLISRSKERLQAAVAALPKTAAQSHDYIVADSSDTIDLRKKVLQLLEQKSIHILINNTGGPKGGPIMEADPVEFLQAFNNHLICNHMLVQLVAEGMKKEGYGRIINITSTSIRQPIPGLGVSNTTRGAVASWAKTMSLELAPFGITINNILPGTTSTSRIEEIITARAKRADIPYAQVEEQFRAQIPMARFASPEEIGAVAAFLASPAASYITGTSIPVDGGRIKSI